ncbi:hypothetical protein ERO13_A10G000650v2 [Gossypium hirsutum]|nr:hypothetical protein ERO13_A10G000650v2 [Gossypium hirsutum]
MGQPKIILLRSGCVKKNWKKRGKENGVITPLIENYWFQRYHLFSKYDEGIKMDEEGWFSVTPVEIAMRHAEKCGGDELVIDCFSGIQCADRKHGDALEVNFGTLQIGDFLKHLLKILEHFH